MQVRYKQDCEEFYGRILDSQNVVSSLEGDSRRSTEDIWKTLYPGEPYELDSECVHQDNMCGQRVAVEKCTKYDLISAVQRQSPFFYQVNAILIISFTFEDQISILVSVCSLLQSCKILVLL